VRLLLIGQGRMGQLILALAPAYQCEIVGVVTSRSDLVPFDAGAEVAIDFSTAAAVPQTIAKLADRGINVVVGTTGWQAEEAAVKARAAQAKLGVIASANFSLGMSVFRQVVASAAGAFRELRDVGAYIHEAHHGGKKDAPSGTARLLEQAMVAAGYDRPIDVSSTRAGAIPGTHTVGFDGPSESVTLTHTVRDRAVFARGALEAARWIQGRHGWFTVDDMMR
jgi:4-hydroxy-tetrahydrodipicolinate reductase